MNFPLPFLSGPLIVCLHGGGFSALTWALFSKHLVEAAQCQVLAIDLRGHGEFTLVDFRGLATQIMICIYGR